jgi:predicted ferric reductase
MDVQRVEKKAGFIIITALSVIPLILWLGLLPLEERFEDIGSSMRSLGQIAGLTGVVLFSIVFVLNTRLKFLEDFFGGQDKVYYAHHFLGATAFILLLFHPFLLGLEYLSFSLNAAISFFLPSNYWAKTFGVISLGLISLLLFITFFVKIKYNKWFFTHQFLGIAFFIAIFHVYFISSDISRSLVLRYYILSFMAIGIAAYIYRTLLGTKVAATLDYEVAKVKRLNKEIVEVSLKPLSKKLSFKSGQFAFVGYEGNNFSTEVHPFTISSSPKEKYLRFSIKSLGDYTSEMEKLKVGTKAKIEGPFGRFSYGIYNNPQIWIAGGIGITPFLSRARNYDNKQKVDLFYSVKTKEEAIFLKELEQIASRNKNLRITPIYSSTQGKIDIEFIKKNSKINQKEIFICGPKGMMESLKEQFLKSGVHKGYIHMEEFSIL